MMVCVLAVCVVGAVRAQTPIRIVAGNITAGNNQEYVDQSTRILQALDPDIALLQEFNVPGTNDTAAIESYVASTFGPGYYTFREPGNQSIPNGIVSKYPFLETGEWDDTVVGDRDFAWARIDIPGSKDLWVVSVHLKASDATKQNTQAGLILSAMAAKGIPTTDYVVIGGDFNTSSRGASCMGTFAGSSWSFATGSPYPVGEDNNSNTNANRNNPYDWVLPNNVLNGIKTNTTFVPRVNSGAGNKVYTNGLVFDTRDFTQSNLNEFFPPALVADSGATNMQHMAVVRTFLVPDGGTPTGPTSGTVATVTLSDLAPATAPAGSAVVLGRVSISVGANEWDAASVQLQELGTVSDTQASASIYLDNNNSGTVDAGDTFLGRSAFVGGNATVSLAPTPRATSANVIRLLAVAETSASGTSGTTVQFRFVANGLSSALSGGVDPNPTFSSLDSGATLLKDSSVPVTPINQASAAAVINKYYNDGSLASNDALEILVIQDGLDLRGAIVKDFSSSMANDNGGKFTLSNNSLWQNLRAGTLITLRNNATAADTTVGGSDFNLDIGLTNATYSSLTAGTFDLSATEMVMLRAAASGTGGTSPSIHCLAAGTAGTQYGLTPAPKLRATSTVGSATYCYVTNSGNTGVSGFNDAAGSASTATSGISFGAGNTAENTAFINFLRGPVPAAASVGSVDGSFIANWSALPTATSYRLDVARDSAFTSFVAGYNNLSVGGVTSFEVSGLADGTFYYRVRAVNSEGTVSGTRGSQSTTLVPVTLSEFIIE